MQTHILTFVIFALLTTPLAVLPWQILSAHAEGTCVSNESKVILPKPSNTPQDAAPGDWTLITGTVRNTDGETVKNATVSVKGRNFAKSVTTGPNGRYSFNLRSGRFTLKTTHPDYKPQSKTVKLREEEQQLVNFTLSRKKR